MDFLTLAEDLALVSGLNRAALYDFRTGQMISISGAACRLLWNGSREGLRRATDLGHERGDDPVRALSELLETSRVSMTAEARPIEIAGPASDELNLRLVDHVWVELTESCNLGCVHCYADAKLRKVLSPRDLPTSFWIDAFRQGKELGLDAVIFTGGEIFLRPDLPEILRATHALDLKIQLLTNGTIVSEKDIDLLREVNAYFCTTLFSHRPEIHDKITRIAGSHRETVGNLRTIVERGISARVSIPVVLDNEGDVPETEKFVRSIGVTNIIIDPVWKVGRGRRASIQPSHEIDRRPVLPVEYVVTHEYFERSRAVSRCWPNALVIGNDGRVFPCLFIRNAYLGSLQEQPLREILTGAPFTEMRNMRIDNVAICKDCEFRYACPAAHCRARALDATGNLLDPVPGCRYNPHAGTWADNFQPPAPLVNPGGLYRDGWDLDRRFVRTGKTLPECNDVAKLLWDACDGQRTVRDLIDIVLDEYDVERDQVQQDVRRFLAQMNVTGHVATAP